VRTTRETPDAARTIHFIGDPHVRVTNAARKNQFIVDCQGGLCPDPVYRVILGDLSNENGSNVNDPDDDATAVAWADSISATVPWATLIGNHDIYNNNRTAAAAATSFGMPSLNQNIDVGFARLLLVNPTTLAAYPSLPAAIKLSQATLDWLEGELAAATKPCLVCCHAPLKDTVIDSAEDGSTVFDSSLEEFHVTREGDTTDTYIRDPLGEYDQAKAWVSGHCHVDARRTGSTLFTTTTCGSRQVASIHAPVVYYVTPTVDVGDPLWSVWVTVRADGKIECRLRNHALGSWDMPADQGRVVVLTPT